MLFSCMQFAVLIISVLVTDYLNFDNVGVKFKDMGFADSGRKDFTLAGHEMSGFMATRAEFGRDPC